MKILCLHTAQFPYGSGEQFIETEIKFLARAFERVIIIPSNTQGKKRSLPKNVQVHIPDYSNYSTIIGFRSLGLWLYYCLYDLIIGKNKWLLGSTLLRLSYQANILLNFLKAQDLISDTLHYTYWFNEQSTLLSILKSKKIIKGYISRAHRFDLYEEINNEKHIPFRKFQLKCVSRLYLISMHGLIYLQKEHPKYSDKYHLSYLGIENKQPFQFAPSQSSPYYIVSCSRLVDIKRVDLIIKGLALIKNISIKWIHFGDGPMFEALKNEAKKLPSNIEYDFKGHVENKSVLDFYSNNYIDLFINVSSSEGLPVTIMEAISFGIPIIATNVGGTSEIVTAETGKLLESKPDILEIKAAIIDTLINKSRKIAVRKKIYNSWNASYNALNNYTNFTKDIYEINL